MRRVVCFGTLGIAMIALWTKVAKRRRYQHLDSPSSHNQSAGIASVLAALRAYVHNVRVGIGDILATAKGDTWVARAVHGHLRDDFAVCVASSAKRLLTQTACVDGQRLMDGPINYRTSRRIAYTGVGFFPKGFTWKRIPICPINRNCESRQNCH